MPDAVTHLCSGLVAQTLAPRGAPQRLAPLFVLGTVLPDLLSRAPGAVAGAIHDHLHPLPPLLLYCWNPLHLPAGIALASALLTMFFPQEQRRSVLIALLAGSALHVGLDLCQRHVGLGYPLLIPFSSADFELGLFGSEATVTLAPFLALGTVVLWGLRWWRERPSASRRRPSA